MIQSKIYKALVCTLLVLSFTNADAQKISQTFFVNDWANVLTEQEAQLLERKIKGYQDSTTTQIAVVLLKSLNGENLEKLSLGIANDWGIGQKRRNNGILILAAMQERKIRIEVGRGLTDRINNAKATRIIQTKITPYFKQQNYYQGLDMAIDRIIVESSGKFKRFRVTFVFIFTIVSSLLWLVLWIIGSRKPFEWGIASIGLFFMEIQWQLSHNPKHIPIVVEIVWVVFLGIWWLIRSQMNTGGGFKKMSRELLKELEERNLTRDYQPAQVNAKLDDWEERLRRGGSQAIEALYHELRKVAANPQNFFTPKPSTSFKAIHQEVKRLQRNEKLNDLQKKYLQWLCDDIEQSAQNLGEAPDSLTTEALNDLIGLYTRLYHLIPRLMDRNVMWTLDYEKYSATKRAVFRQQVTEVLTLLPKYNVSTMPEEILVKAQSLSRDMDSIKRNAASFFGADMHWLLVKLGQFIGVSVDKEQEFEQIQNELSGKKDVLEQHQRWELFKNWADKDQLKKLKAEVMAAYEAWDKLSVKLQDTKDQRLVDFYDTYIKTPLREHPYIRRKRPDTGYNPLGSFGSGSSSGGIDLDYDDYSGNSGSAWGGGSFDGDGGSGSW